MIERFREWYRYEQDCNAKVIGMLASVPVERRGEAAFVRVVGKAAHIQAARHMWLFRLGVRPDKPASSFPESSLAELEKVTADVEASWVKYLGELDEAKLHSEVEWVGFDGKRRKWPLVELLTQINGHAWYHRGQVAMWVKDLGGTPVDTDFIFWKKPVVLE